MNENNTSYDLVNKLSETDIDVFVRHDRGPEIGACLKNNKRTSHVKRRSKLAYKPTDDNTVLNKDFSVIYRFSDLPKDRLKGIKIALANEALIAELNNPDINPIPHHVSFYKRADGDFEIEIHYTEIKQNVHLHPNVQHP
ncbi:MAG: hypothetical protein JJ966_08170 [Balneolaceae bacterium]|nr:hypothetical protein [Balneolaceae bacterium]